LKIRRLIAKRWRESSSVKAVTALTGSSMAIMAVGVVGSFIQSWFVSPDDLGYFRQFSIISGYLFFLHLGVFHALERSYPYYIGRNEKERAVALAAVGQTWILAVTVPIALAFGVLAYVSFFAGNWKSGLGWLSQVVLNTSALYGGYLGTIYRSGHDFQKYAKAQMWSVPAVVLTLPVFWIQPYLALVLKNTVGSLTTLWQLHRYRPIKVGIRVNLKEFRELICQGLPRFSASYMTTTGVDTLTATIVLCRLDRVSLGYWSFACMAITLAYQLPQAMTAVYIPRVAELYGKTGSVQECVKLWSKPLAYGGAILVVIVACGMLATYYLLPVILPKYAAARGIICLLLLGLPFKMLDALASVLSMIDWMLILNVRAVISVIFQIGCAVLGLMHGWGLYGVALGVLFAGVIRALIIGGTLTYACILERRTNSALNNGKNQNVST
jgi:hypothetical protein